MGVSIPYVKRSSMYLRDQACPAETSFPPGLQQVYMWRMAPQKFEGLRLCLVEQNQSALHLAVSQQLGNDDAKVDNAAIGNFDHADDRRPSSVLRSEGNQEDHILSGIHTLPKAANKKVIIITAIGLSFLALAGVTLCLTRN